MLKLIDKRIFTIYAQNFCLFRPLVEWFHSLQRNTGYMGNSVEPDQLASTEARKRSGSVVECLTQDPRVAGSSLTGITVLCP